MSLYLFILTKFNQVKLGQIRDTLRTYLTALYESQSRKIIQISLKKIGKERKRTFFRLTIFFPFSEEMTSIQLRR